MTIDTSQNVGIGTTSPASKLHVRASSTGSTANGIILDAGAQQHSWYLADNFTSTFSIGSSAGLWTWSNSGGERMRLDSSGNLLFNSGYGSVATAYGCRAWVCFAGASGVRRASGNVTSVTRAGTGQYTINFTTALVDANYSIVGSASENGATVNIFMPYGTGGAKTTTACAVQTLTTASGFVDPTDINVAVFR
jgi:hypothetical protein